MNWQCFGLSSIVLMMAVVMIFTNKFLKKLLNFYFFWLGLSLLIISWFITFRFGCSWKTYHQYLHNKTIIKDPINDYEQSIIISKALLLDISPAVGILLNVTVPVAPLVKPTVVLCDDTNVEQLASLYNPIVVVAFPPSLLFYHYFFL